MSPKIKGILRIFLPALAVGILLSLLFLALMNGPLAQPAADPAAAPTATPAAEATPYDPSVTPDTKYCPYCGEKIPAASKFCPKCGAQLPPRSEKQ